MRVFKGLLLCCAMLMLLSASAKAIPSGTYDYHPLHHSKNRLQPAEVYKYLMEYVGFLDRVERTLELIEGNLLRQASFNQLDSRQRIEVLQNLRELLAETTATRKLLLELNVSDHDHYDLATAQAIHERFITARTGLDRMILAWLAKDLDYQYQEFVKLRSEQEGFERGWFAHMVATYAYVDRLLLENRIDIRQ